MKYDRAVSEVVVRFALSVFPFGLLLPSYNLGCLTFSFDVCIADDVSSCGVRVPFPALGRTRYRAWSWRIVTILSTSLSPLWCRISACLLSSSVRTDPFAEHLTRDQNPGGWALQLHGDFCSRVQLGRPPGHERRIEGGRSTSIGEGNISCIENLTCSHGNIVDIVTDPCMSTYFLTLTRTCRRRRIFEELFRRREQFVCTS